LKSKKKYLLFIGLILIALGFFLTVVLISRRYEALWFWYEDLRQKLTELEDYIMNLNKLWQFIGAILLLYIVKCFFPIYPASTLCLISGLILPLWIAIPVNMAGVAIQMTIKYFWGKRFGAGYSWKLIKKNETLYRMFKSNGKVNSALLFTIRLVPSTPVNMISAIYGSFDFGYRKFLLLSIAGFFPKLVVFTFTGKNMYDPLSAGFLVPIIILLFLTGFTLLSANGAWTVVEQIMKLYNNSKAKQALRESAEQDEIISGEGETTKEINKGENTDD
ncbi:MAG: TVP38/TMEM64 family protein, partial [Clostridia bacterium]|nr:TVP38/TMEM64 family protein [Clostridia bacterium]